MDNLIDWFYSQVVGFLGNFFAEMGNMGVELFDLEWVQAIILFFSQLAWALFAVSLVVSAFEFGIEYSSGRGNLQQTAVNALKGFSYRNFPPWLVAPSMLTAEAAAKVHPPLWTLWSFQGFGHTIIVFLPEGYFPVVKGRLYLLDIPIRVFHGREPQAIPQTFQSGLPLQRGRAVLSQEGVKFLPVPQVGLFHRRQALAGQKQTKKVLKAPGQRVNIVSRKIGGVNGEHHLSEALHEAIVDAVHSLPADHLAVIVLLLDSM